MLLIEIVTTSTAVRATRSRLAKVQHLAELLKHLIPEETAAAVSFLAGEPRQKRLGVGYSSVAGVTTPPAAGPSLEVLTVDAMLDSIAGESGPGSTGRRIAALEALFGQATAEEQTFLRGMILRNLRQGASDGIMVEALAAAIDAPPPDVRRAVMMAGSLVEVAEAALRTGVQALDDFRLELFRPVLPMLAQSTPDVTTALEKTGQASVEAKLDGVRIQVHRRGKQIAVYTRNLRDVTGSSPDLVAAVASLDLSAVVLDGEALAVRGDGRPLPFQESMAEFGAEAGAARVVLRPFFFDILHLDGHDLIDLPASKRWSHLVTVVDQGMRVERVETGDPEVAETMYRRTIESGHEGVVVKSLDSPYEAGRRGASWIKVKPAHTLDLVVMAVEWGSGRRKGWLSNLHLGARDPSTGGFVMLGKTFKGMTDAMLEWQTERFLGLETGRAGHVVTVRPEQVVEIAFDGLQASTRYPGGMALRFARVKRYRDDKTAEQADTIETVRSFFKESRA